MSFFDFVDRHFFGIGFMAIMMLLMWPSKQTIIHRTCNCDEEDDEH